MVIISREEEMKRQPVFIKTRKTVLVKIFAMGVLPGLEKKERDEAKIDAQHKAEAEQRGLNFVAYREKGDTGYCLYQKEEGVRITRLFDHLAPLGLHYVGGHWQQAENKGQINTLVFSVEGASQPLPTSAVNLLHLRFNNCTVWCNLKYNEIKVGGQYRLDTVNLTRGRKTNEPSRELVVHGNTYRLL